MTTETPTDELTDDERELLEFEQFWWKFPAAKETAVRERWGYGSTRHYQRLNALLDRPAALAAYPMLVRRLLRLREARRRQRDPRRLGLEISGR